MPNKCITDITKHQLLWQLEVLVFPKSNRLSNQYGVLLMTQTWSVYKHSVSSMLWMVINQINLFYMNYWCDP